MRVVPGGIGVLLLSVAMFCGVAVQAAEPIVITPDSLVLREPFVSEDGVVQEVDIAPPQNIVFRDPFISEDGAIEREDVAPAAAIVFRDPFVGQDGLVNDVAVARPAGIVVRQPFIAEDGTVTNPNVEAPEGIVFQDPFIYETGHVSAAPTPGAPALELITVQGIYPNPFNPSTRISFRLNRSADVEVLVLDLSGKLVSRLFQGRLAADLHVLQWNGKIDGGGQAASGQYLFRIQAGSEVVQAKGLLIK